MANWRKISMIALLLAAMGTASADTLEMSGSSAATNDGRPTRGMTQARVEAKYGSPSSVKAPVGEPPISSWEYTDFVVYFEYDRVIHAVVKR
jgi:hypothetical protein